MDIKTQVELQATVTLAITYFIQYIKKSKWFPWFTKYTETANHLLHIAVSVLAAFGIQVSTTGFNIDHLLSTGLQFIQTYLLSKGAYHLLLAPNDTVQVPATKENITSKTT
jgi:hypothetical protein